MKQSNLPMRTTARIYIIHIEARSGGVSHYIGYTQRRLLSKRLEEHRNNPRQLTRREAIRQARHVFIRTIDSRGDVHREKYYQAFPEELVRVHLCPICKKLTAAGLQIENGRTREDPPASFPGQGNPPPLEEPVSCDGD